jgi:hypothetical protein
MAALIVGAMIVGGIIGVLSGARAHSYWAWIEKYRDPQSNQLCCGKIDCFETPKDLVEETPLGFYLHEYRETIPHSRRLVSEDGKYWVCLHSPFQTPRRGVRCLFTPYSGS